MRTVARVTVAVLLAYLIQATVLPYFRINGVMLDLIVITVFTAGYTLGAYGGIMAGLFAALILESISGDLSGFMAAASVLSGAYGAYVAPKVRGYTKVGNRRQERLVKRFTPMLAAGLFEVVKEAVYVVYFYLTGVDLAFFHFFRMVFSGIEVALCSVVLMPLLMWFYVRRPENTLAAKWLRRRREKNAPRPVSPKVAAAGPAAANILDEPIDLMASPREEAKQPENPEEEGTDA